MATCGRHTGQHIFGLEGSIEIRGHRCVSLQLPVGSKVGTRPGVRVPAPSFPQPGRGSPFQLQKEGRPLWGAPGAETLLAFREEAGGGGGEQSGASSWELLPPGTGTEFVCTSLKLGDESRAHMAALIPSSLGPRSCNRARPSPSLHPGEQKQPQAKGVSPLGGLECKQRKHPLSWGIYPPIDRPTQGKSDIFPGEDGAGVTCKMQGHLQTRISLLLMPEHPLSVVRPYEKTRVWRLSVGGRPP